MLFELNGLGLNNNRCLNAEDLRASTAAGQTGILHKHRQLGAQDIKARDRDATGLTLEVLN